MTKHEAAVISAYTGILIGRFSDMHGYAEKLFGRPIFTHEFGSDEIADKLKELSKPDLLAIHQSIK